MGMNVTEESLVACLLETYPTTSEKEKRLRFLKGVEELEPSQSESIDAPAKVKVMLLLSLRTEEMQRRLLIDSKATASKEENSVWIGMWVLTRRVVLHHLEIERGDLLVAIPGVLQGGTHAAHPGDLVLHEGLLHLGMGPKEAQKRLEALDPREVQYLLERDPEAQEVLMAIPAPEEMIREQRQKTNIEGLVGEFDGGFADLENKLLRSAVAERLLR